MSRAEISISTRSVVLVGAAVAIGWALASIASVLLVLFVTVFGIAVLSQVAAPRERRFGWSPGLSATVVMLAIVIVVGDAGADSGPLTWSRRSETGGVRAPSAANGAA